MFERFDEPARRVIVLAQQAARSRWDRAHSVGNLEVDEIVTSVVESHGIDHDAVQQQIEGAIRALADLGLDTDELVTNIRDEYSRSYSTASERHELHYGVSLTTGIGREVLFWYPM